MLLLLIEYNYKKTTPKSCFYVCRIYSFLKATDLFALTETTVRFEGTKRRQNNVPRVRYSFNCGF